MTVQLNPCPAPRLESDEYVCTLCRLRWDMHEEKPECPAESKAKQLGFM